MYFFLNFGLVLVGFGFVDFESIGLVRVCYVLVDFVFYWSFIGWFGIG